MPNLYRRESNMNPKWDAQRNLSGRTHYVDDDTLRYHKARILSTRATDGGLLFALVESVALDPDNRKRGVRYVIFDVFGHIVGNRQDLDHCWRRSEQAEKAMWAELETLDAKAITEAAIARAEAGYAYELTRLREDMAKALGQKVAAE